MPDENKFAKLEEVNYTIRPCCFLCKHGTFYTFALWGTCAKHTYKHKKHTGNDRQMSINIIRSCDDYDGDDNKINELGNFVEFYKDEIK